MKPQDIKKIVKERYSEIASKEKSCCSCDCSSPEQISKSIGYSDEEMNNVPEANLGLGCGNPVALSRIKEGDIVLDLGSGAGFDAFLTAKKVGETGKVIGIDMTLEMIEKAKKNAERYGYSNVEFRLGDIENLCLEDNSIDVIISNCVINLSPNKDKVFSEAYRVLKKGGRMYVSDIVLLEELSEQQRNDKNLISGCVGGALLKEDYLEKIRKAGFDVNLLGEDEKIGKTQYRGINLESLKVEGVKI